MPTLLAAGVIADRTPRKAVMIASDLIRLVAQAGTATLLLTRSAHLWELMVLAALYGFGEALFRPTSTGFIPEVVPAARLQQAMALLATATSVSTVVGPAIAGVLVIALSPGWAIGVDAVTFAASAMLLLGVPSKLSVRRSVPTVWSDLREGWTMFRSRKWLWVDGIYAALGNAIVLAPLLALGPLVASRHLGSPASAQRFAALPPASRWSRVVGSDRNWPRTRFSRWRAGATASTAAPAALARGSLARPSGVPADPPDRPCTRGFDGCGGFCRRLWPGRVQHTFRNDSAAENPG